MPDTSVGQLNGLDGKPLMQRQWEDAVREEDCGQDRLGHRHQDGRVILCEPLDALRIRDGEVSAWDDVTSAYLDPVLAQAARKIEMDYFESMFVFEKVPREVMYECDGTLIDTHWIDTNNGDSRSPSYRSRLVGREYRLHSDAGLYSAPPPLEALRSILSFAATNSHTKSGNNKERALVTTN